MNRLMDLLGSPFLARLHYETPGGAGGGGGAAGGGAGGGGGAAGGEGGQGAGEGAGQGEGGQGGAGGEGAGEGGQGNDETVTLSVDEVNRLRQAAARGAQEARQAARERERQEAEQRREAGQYEELYNTERGRTERITGIVTDTARNMAVSSVARTLGFANPDLAKRLISVSDINVNVDLDDENVTLDALDQAVDTAGRTLIEQRLRKVADENPGLLGQAPPRQLAGAGQVTAANGGSEEAGNAAMNAAIRRSAGRPA